MKGKFIVLEGVEGSGKTTQLQRTQTWLASGEWLQHLSLDPQVLPSQPPDIQITREPGGTTLGTKLRQLLLQPDQDPIHDRAELLLYAADRAQHVEKMLRPLLAQGVWVLCDRYVESTIAYQGYGRGLDGGLIDQLNQIATGGLVSDLTLWLDVAAATGLARAKGRSAADRMEQADLAFHQRVQQGYAALAAAAPDRVVRIDASLGAEAVAQQIQSVLCQKLRQWYQPLSLPSEDNPKP